MIQLSALLYKMLTLTAISPGSKSWIHTNYISKITLSMQSAEEGSTLQCALHCHIENGFDDHVNQYQIKTDGSRWEDI